MNSKIIFAGGSGRFGKIFKDIKSSYKILYPSKELNILKLNSIIRYIKKQNQNILSMLLDFQGQCQSMIKILEKVLNLI